jgi:hypothetical protein|tara:strand:+ start:384 stop:566 length:183 start_codon:yes stop_codon:yes gene_type:complete
MPKLKITKGVEPKKVEKKLAKGSGVDPKVCVNCGARVNEVQTKHEGNTLCGIPCFNQFVS